jgi:hypothetical protein
MTSHHQPRLVVNNDSPPIDYPTGIRFVPHVTVPVPMFTGDELLWACFFTGVASVLLTCVAALIWGAVS